MKISSKVAFGLVVLVGLAGRGTHAQTTLAPREVPAKSIPVPLTVSPQMQAIIAAPLREGWDVLPKNGEEWHARATAAATTLRLLPGMRERLHVKTDRPRLRVCGRSL